MSKTSQNQMVIDYMNEKGWITQQEASYYLGITRLASRIADIKEKGYIVIDEWVNVINRFGKKGRVKRYRLAGEEDVI